MFWIYVQVKGKSSCSQQAKVQNQLNGQEADKKQEQKWSGRKGTILGGKVNQCNTFCKYLNWLVGCILRAFTFKVWLNLILEEHYWFQRHTDRNTNFLVPVLICAIQNKNMKKKSYRLPNETCKHSCWTFIHKHGIRGCNL